MYKPWGEIYHLITIKLIKNYLINYKFILNYDQLVPKNIYKQPKGQPESDKNLSKTTKIFQEGFANKIFYQLVFTNCTFVALATKMYSFHEYKTLQNFFENIILWFSHLQLGMLQQKEIL